MLRVMRRLGRGCCPLGGEHRPHEAADGRLGPPVGRVLWWRTEGAKIGALAHLAHG